MLIWSHMEFKTILAETGLKATLFTVFQNLRQHSVYALGLYGQSNVKVMSKDT